MTLDSEDTLSKMEPAALLQKLLEYKELYERECEEFEEYKANSQEMEQMMEKEIEDAKKQTRTLESQTYKLKMDNERLQSRHEADKKEWLKIEETLRKEVCELRGEREQTRDRLRRLEQRNDDLERTERINQQLLEDFEKKWNETVERTALLESELADKADGADEAYRLREELKSVSIRPLAAVEPLQRGGEEAGPAGGDSSGVGGEGGGGEKREEAMETDERADSGVDERPVSVPDSGGFATCVNRIVKDLLVKVDRLEGLLTLKMKE